MDIFPLAIFPDGGLASSVITTVWVGVFVLCFFNLRFGWVLSGLVVPGYLVPLLIVKPIAAAVIVVEAILTYAIVWIFSEKISRGRFPALFGRDRFMGLVLASIAVRLSFDGYLLPLLADWLLENFDRRFDWNDNLQSFGLVIISLLANQFWKPGLGRGLAAAVVTIGLTYLIVRYGLMELTNFRMSGVSYLYEGLASSILASPKAYIILVITAMLASQVNVRYGWDFSGILIPALIALQWYQPTKVLTSFLEAIVIYFIARLILKLPVMANATIEGGRKLLLFFNISFAWKMVVGWVIVWWGFDVKTTDLYGFGYLLSTLIAIKAHDKNIFPRLARSTLQVSLAGAVLGNLIGFGLSAVVSRAQSTASAEALDGAGAELTPRLNALVVRSVGDAWVRKVRADAQPLSAPATETLHDLIELFEASIPASSPSFDLTASDWRVQRVEGGRFAIIRADEAGEELLVYDPKARRELAVIVPDPTEAPGLAAAALQLQRSQDARWLILAAPTGAAEIAGNPVIETFRATSTMARLTVVAGPASEGARAVFANRAAGTVDLAALRTAVRGLSVSLRPLPGEVVGDEGEIALDNAALAALSRLASAPDVAGTAIPPCSTPSAGNLSKGWDELGQLAFLRYEVAAPLLQGVDGGMSADVARASAGLGGFTLDQCRLGTRVQWRLFAPFRDEGYLFLARGQAPAKVVLTYRDPLTPFAARAGAAVAREWGADALLIGPETDSLFRPALSSFDVLWQEVARHQRPVDGVSVFQLRLAPHSAQRLRGSSDVVVARDIVATPDTEFLPIVSALRMAGLRAILAGTDDASAGFEKRPGTALRYLDQVSGRRYAIGWVMVEPPPPVPVVPPPAPEELRR
ncbi:poly-gamma-glutamate biosynthesis protein PgsC/CapC [Erythrobacter sp. SDW2]|uniref:poly-gamma-glutamate biosynthesis protein PgsC/CapC n=1 Tax=Erythrobacter sp. SDW2 TaxID=2907154 RepID=UPI001F2D6154|nr:poly-gamma-glutamate biosynthesis protein PgsC/CapC [Erythrobacter sp. SDW2]UIP07323.1 poly-gamma-glutamate biosynthesis protein PgsC/CapC [Erythrobacter sp. SDW2]